MSILSRLRKGGWNVYKANITYMKCLLNITGFRVNVSGLSCSEMLLWFLNCSNITYTIPVMFLELSFGSCRANGWNFPSKWYRWRFDSTATAAALFLELGCVVFLLYQAWKFSAKLPSLTLVHTQLWGAYACVYSRYIYIYICLGRLRNIWMTVCICEPANLWDGF